MCSDRRMKESSAQGTGQPDDKWDVRMLTFGCMAAYTNKEPNGEEIFEHLLMLVHSEEGQLCLSKDFQFFTVMTWCMVPETHAWKGQRNREQRSQRQLLEFARLRALEPWIQKVHSSLKLTRCGHGTSSCPITAYVRYQCRPKKDLEVIRKGGLNLCLKWEVSTKSLEVGSLPVPQS